MERIGYRWLHTKPLYAAIGRVLAPYQPGGRHGDRRRRCAATGGRGGKFRIRIGDVVEYCFQLGGCKTPDQTPWQRVTQNKVRPGEVLCK
jgi:hypothetical protein